MSSMDCVLLVLACSVCASQVVYSAVLRDELYKLDIVHYNDFHDRFEETSVFYPICKTNDSQCIGGFARLYSGIKSLLSEKPDALLLNAGDTFQGTYWYTLLKWNIIQKFINMLPNDVHAIGNHEFDDGIAGLSPYLKSLKAPVVAANLDSTKEPSLQGLYRPHVILERKGRKIGVIGLITTETGITSNAENTIFLDPIETVKKEADILTGLGVDIIIVLSHCGLNVDRQLAKEVGENIDIIVGGHSHSLLWNGESPSNESISGPYPVLVECERKPAHKVLIVTASAFSKYLGNMTAYFDSHGELTSFEGSPIFLNRSIPEDPQIKSLLQPFKDQLDAIVHEEVGFTNEDLIGDPCGSTECTIGDLIADSFMYIAKEKSDSDLPYVVLLNRNMIRGSISKGLITKGSIITTLPFTNKVVTLTLQGRYLVEALERCLTQSWSADPFSGPWMPQVAGMQVTLNTTAKTVTKVLVEEGDSWKPLESDKDYKVVTIAFLAKGGNGFKMFKNNARDVIDTGITSEKALEIYIRKNTPLTPELDRRLTLTT